MYSLLQMKPLVYAHMVDIYRGVQQRVLELLQFTLHS